MSRNVWSIVLAAGEGTRLRTLTTDRGGRSVPKQYCAFGSSSSLLRDALDRGAAASSPARVVPIVAAQHRRWWESELADVPRENVVVQPTNRGTAAGVLLPLIRVLQQDPDATVLILPSDHFVENEAALRRAIAESLASVARRPWTLTLLGVRPDAPDPGFGWVTSAPGRAGEPLRVQSFIEKPSAERATRLMKQGALVNTFIFTARAATLTQLYGLTVPDLLYRFTGSTARLSLNSSAALEEVYQQTPNLDFSRDVMQSEAIATRLRLIQIPDCGWSDLGTPERVAASCTRYRIHPRSEAQRSSSRPLDLAAAIGQISFPRLATLPTQVA